MLKQEINLKNGFYDLPFNLDIHYSHQGIRSVFLHPSKEGLKWTFVCSQQNIQLEELVGKWLEEYCQKKVSSIQLPFDWTSIPPFTQYVLKTMAVIPFGTLTSYGQLAHSLGYPKAARAVGGACRRNPFVLFIPCHRVLDAKFELRGYSAGGIHVKEKLLMFEGSRT